jgi:hypothetical protein
VPDQFGEIIELDAHRGKGLRSLGEITRDALAAVAHRTQAETLRNELSAQKRAESVLREAIKRAESLVLYVTHAGAAGPAVSAVRGEGVEYLEGIRGQRAVVLQTIEMLERALSDVSPPDDPPPSPPAA